jgi:hypothetical protein
MGGGWRVPTRRDFEIIRSNSIKKSLSTFNNLNFTYSDPKRPSDSYKVYLCSDKSPDGELSAFDFNDGIAYMSAEESRNILRMIRAVK